MSKNRARKWDEISKGSTDIGVQIGGELEVLDTKAIYIIE